MFKIIPSAIALILLLAVTGSTAVQGADLGPVTDPDVGSSDTSANPATPAAVNAEVRLCCEWVVYCEGPPSEGRDRKCWFVCECTLDRPEWFADDRPCLDRDCFPYDEDEDPDNCAQPSGGVPPGFSARLAELSEFFPPEWALDTDSATLLLDELYYDAGDDWLTRQWQVQVLSRVYTAATHPEIGDEARLVLHDGLLAYFDGGWAQDSPILEVFLARALEAACGPDDEENRQLVEDLYADARQWADELGEPVRESVEQLAGLAEAPASE